MGRMTSVPFQFQTESVTNAGRLYASVGTWVRKQLGIPPLRKSVLRSIDGNGLLAANQYVAQCGGNFDLAIDGLQTLLKLQVRKKQ